jgi:adenine-specific DNA-methyltransferase
MTMEKLKMHSIDLIEDNVDRIAELFPTVITESRDVDGNTHRVIDFDMLRQELSREALIVEGAKERYQLDWPGKRAGAFASNTPIARTLRPVRDESVNFDALKLLQESYLGKVDLIYIDPPYNTGTDLIYKDDRGISREEYLDRSGQIDDEKRRLVANTSANGRFHSDWLDMIYPRLRLARNVLAPTGMVFVSIGDEELAQLRLLCDEVFGPENFVAQLTIEMSTTQGMKVRAAQRGAIVKNSEFVLVYSRTPAHLEIKKTPLFDSVSGWPGNFATWLHGDLRFEPLAAVLNRQVALRAEALRFAGVDEVRTKDLSLLLACSPVFQSFVEENLEHIAASDKGVWPAGVPQPNWQDGQAYELNTEERSYVVMKSSKGTLRQFLRLSDSYRQSDDYSTRFGRTVIRGDLWKGFYSDMAHVSLEGSTAFENGKKPVRLIRNLVKWANDSPDALIMDFFAGSGTTADAVWRMNAEDGGNRRVVLVQFPEPVAVGSSPAEQGFEVISDVTRQRLLRSAASIEARSSFQAVPIDLGFRVLRVDTTNLADTLRAPDDLVQSSLLTLTPSVKSDRTPEDLLFQVLLDCGLELSLPIACDEVGSDQVFSVDGDALIACFADSLTDDLVRSVARRRPLRAVFMDAAFADDAARINAEQIFRELSPETQVKTL